MTDINEIATIDSKENLLPVDPMVSMIERIVLDPNSDLDKLERMLTMKKELDKDDQAKLFNAAMAACQAEMPSIATNKANGQTRSRYANLEAIYAGAKPVITRHGLSFSTFPAPSEKDGFQGVRWTLRHSAGHVENGIAEIPVDGRGMKGTPNKTGTHAFGSTASYARRYLFCMIFDIATGDDNDGNRRKPDAETVNADQFFELNTLIEETGTSLDKFILAYGGTVGVTTLDEFPASQFEKAKAQLISKKGKMQ